MLKNALPQVMSDGYFKACKPWNNNLGVEIIPKNTLPGDVRQLFQGLVIFSVLLSIYTQKLLHR